MRHRFATTICLGCVLLGQQPTSRGESKPVGKLGQVKKLNDELADIGAAAVKVLTDPKQPKSARLEAVKVIAEARYAPAIPHLIANIDLVDPAPLSRPESDPHKGMVCADALGAIGPEARGAILNAAIKEQEPDRYYLYVSILQKGSLVTSRRETYQLLIGIGYQSNDKRVRDRVVRLIEDIANDIDRLVDVPSDWRIGK